MKCEGCAKTVRETLARVAGVTEVTVDLNKKTATVISDAPEQALTAALKDTSIVYFLSDERREEI